MRWRVPAVVLADVAAGVSSFFDASAIRTPVGGFGFSFSRLGFIFVDNTHLLCGLRGAAGLAGAGALGAELDDFVHL
jgi:hypothetical protein